MLSEEQHLIQDMARSFARERLAPGAKTREAAKCIESEILRELAELGFLGMTIDPDMGGAGADYVSYALALMELARGDGAVSTMVSVHNAPYLSILDCFANGDQKERWLRPGAEGKYIGCFGLTEPGAGSDAGMQKTTARRTNAGYVINGSKQFITSAVIGSATILFASTDPAAGKKGITAFIAEHETPGFSVHPAEHKLGQQASDTCALTFENMELPDANRIGEEGQGYSIALSSLETGRIGIAAQSVGMAQAALDYSLAYARERETFGKPILDHQAVRFRLADMDTRIEAARQLTLNAARMKDAGRPCLREAAMAKLFASTVAEKVASDAIQVHGGYGYLTEYPVEKIYRDVRVCQIYEGTSDIQRLIISRELEKGHAI